MWKLHKPWSHAISLTDFTYLVYCLKHSLLWAPNPHICLLNAPFEWLQETPKLVDTNGPMVLPLFSPVSEILEAFPSCQNPWLHILPLCQNTHLSNQSFSTSCCKWVITTLKHKFPLAPRSSYPCLFISLVRYFKEHLCEPWHEQVGSSVSNHPYFCLPTVVIQTWVTITS